MQPVENSYSLLNKLGNLCSLILLISQVPSKPRESLSIGSCRTSFCVSRVSFMAEAFSSSITGTWGPLRQCCSACIWHVSPQVTQYGDTMGLKITACICSWDRFWTKDTKRPKTQLPFLKNLEQNLSEARIGYCACPLHSTSPKEWVKHLSHPSGLTPGHTFTLILYKEQIGTLLYGASEQGKLVSSWSHLLQQGPQ